MGCIRDYTYIYSSGSIDALEELVNEIFLLLNSPLRIKDVFYYGVFCKEDTYANFSHWDEAPESLEVPGILTNRCSTPYERYDYVKSIMLQVLRGEIEKPSWMTYVEMEEVCGEYEMAPSTFLYIEVKDKKYQILADKLINFLYSPNMMMTFVNDNSDD